MPSGQLPAIDEEIGPDAHATSTIVSGIELLTAAPGGSVHQALSVVQQTWGDKWALRLEKCVATEGKARLWVPVWDYQDVGGEAQHRQVDLQAGALYRYRVLETGNTYRVQLTG